MNPIAEYLEQLSRLLRRRRRRRILDEVKAHLLDAAAADPLAAVDPPQAARRAVERFGPPARVAGQFNALRPRRARRSLAVTLVAALMASSGTATVWALEPAAAHTVSHASARRQLHRGAHRARHHRPR